jgi:predicted SnoaL-like aldol condensation-catalyzing enzyme
MSKPSPTPPHHQSSSELLENNKQLVRNFINDVLNRHDISAADKYFSRQNPIRHNQQVMGTEGFKEHRRTFFEQFPDSHTTIDHILAEDDKVFAMMTGTATDNQTGKRVTMKAADLFRIENGVFVEHWDVVDRSGMQ